MARMIPPLCADDTPPGERRVFDLLKNDTSCKNWIVLHSLMLPKHRSQTMGELDFVILVPGQGVVALEIKSHLKIEFTDGEWLYGNNRKPGKDPFKQAREGMFSMRNELLKKTEWVYKIPFAHGVCFPAIGFPILSLEWDELQIIDQPTLASDGVGNAISKLLFETIEKKLSGSGVHTGPEELTTNRCEDLVSILRPSFEMISVGKLVRAEQEAQLIKLTKRQYEILDLVESNHRVILNGPAGTGKTILTTEALRRAGLQGFRVAFFCYNRNLAKEIESHFDTAASALITNIDSWLAEITGSKKTKLSVNSEEYFGEVLPEQAALAILENDQLCNTFDLLVIDEAQDLLKPQYLELFDLLLKGGLRGGKWIMAGDFSHQVVYSNGSLTVESFKEKYDQSSIELTLTKNCRNSPEIGTFVAQHSSISPLYSGYLRDSFNQEPSLHFYDDEQTQLREIQNKISELLESGVQAKDIVLLSPLKKNSAGRRLEADPSSQFKVREFGQTTRPSIRYSTIHAFKGLESYAVILTDLNSLSQDYETVLFYVATTRALSRLELFCHTSVKADLRKLFTQ